MNSYTKHIAKYGGDCRFLTNKDNQKIFEQGATQLSQVMMRCFFSIETGFVAQMAMD